MDAIASQITSLTVVYSTVYSDADQRKHQSSASLAFLWGIHRGPVNSPHKWPVTRKMFPFDDVIMSLLLTIAKQQQTRHQQRGYKVVIFLAIFSDTISWQKCFVVWFKFHWRLNHNRHLKLFDADQSKRQILNQLWHKEMEACVKIVIVQRGISLALRWLNENVLVCPNASETNKRSSTDTVM